MELIGRDLLLEKRDSSSVCASDHIRFGFDGVRERGGVGVLDIGAEPGISAGTEDVVVDSVVVSDGRGSSPCTTVGAGAPVTDLFRPVRERGLFSRAFTYGRRLVRKLTSNLSFCSSSLLSSSLR